MVVLAFHTLWSLPQGFDLPQGKAEKDSRVLGMVTAMDDAGFGNCTNYGECQAVCPKGITLDFIAQMNRDYAVASVKKIFGNAG
jgi:succinate dehydrogenase / fumarate reductase iron-sulfur subunit